MNTLKDAIGDYIYDNYNRNSQGNFLKSKRDNVGIELPLKDEQIKVTKRDMVLIKQKNRGQSDRNKPSSFGGYGYGAPKKENFKQFDLKTNQIVEVQKKKKKPYEEDSASDH